MRRNLIACILPPCPRCAVPSDQFKRHEIRKRQFNIILDQIVQTVIGLLIRWACPGCGKTCSQYPEFAVPYKRYVLPDIIQYANRYLEDPDMTYELLVKKWAAGYQREAGDEAQLWPSTIHRWITTLGGLPQTMAKTLQLIRQKNPNAATVRHLSQLSVSNRKFKTDERRIVLIRCRQLLLLDRLFHHIFNVFIFPKLAADCGFT